ncbi:MAG: menaquinone biosynthesis protein [Planctomycetes bacterium]|nr:menaquinone biosynthesis protein [Planctomycetota bacterium]
MDLPPLRVGTVPYLVGRPLDFGLGAEPGIELSQHVPAQLVERLRDGRLDVALVSSIELFRTPGTRFIDGPAVAGASEVASVQLFLRRPIQDVRTIALDPASRAAATLVRVLCERPLSREGSGRPRVVPRFVEVEPGVDPRAVTADAWLRIGDAALRERLTEPDLPYYNPSREWAARTALPFVFACWIVRAGVELDPAHIEAFARARERGTEQREDLAREAAALWNLPLAACRRYLLEECLYEPGPALRPALLRFRDEAAALGLCDGTLNPDRIELAHVT